MSSSKSTDLVRIIPSPSKGEPASEHARRLTGLSVALDKPHAFEKGQIVRWKAGLKNRAIPAYNEGAIIREVLAAPVYDGCETARCASGPYFGEPLSLVLGIVDPDGHFVELRYDARRFEPYRVSV
jgi:hypothetical protein